MADISKIKLPGDNTEYNIKDSTARAQSGVTGVKGNAESSYRTGQVNLTYSNLGTAPVENGGTGATSASNAANNLLVLSLAAGTAIAANTDLNTITTPGNYYCHQDATAKTIVNRPIGLDYGFTMHIGYPLGRGTTQYVYQEITQHTNGMKWYREHTKANVWRPWTESGYQRIISRGEQLVVNGNGFMGDNTNWSNWVFDGSVANGSKGSFTRTPSFSKASLDEFIPVDPSKNYTIEFDVKCGTDQSLPVGAKMYAFINYFDVDNLQVGYYHGVYHRPETTTTLSQDLNDGDTVVHFTDLSNWFVSTTASHQRSLIFWDYTNSFGYTYPSNTYSRHEAHEVYASDTSVNKTNNTIALSSAWNKGTVPAGTKVSQNASGGSYDYYWWHTTQSTFPTEWLHVKATRGAANMWKGVATVKLGFLWNYAYTESAKQQQIWVTNLSMKTDTFDTSSTIPISNGGTGKTTAAEAWTALGGGAIGKKASLAASDIPAHASTATTYGAASTSNYGHAKLSSATNSSSEDLAATPKAVKAAYDLATTANTNAGSAMSAATGAYVLNVTYTISNGTVTCSAHVYSAGSEVTSTFADSCFTWSYNTGAGWVATSTHAKTYTPSVLSSFGGSVKCDFTPPSN